MEKWVVAAKKADFNLIGRQFHIDPVIARLIRNRDVIGEDKIREYLSGTVQELPSPWLMKDMEKAVDILEKKISQKAKVRIIGDYDIDGVTSTYILMKGLARIGADVDTYIPDRVADGYGIHAHLIERAETDRIDTIVTCDNGIAAAAEIQMAKDKGMTVIITDHHEVPYREEKGERQMVLPPADAILNPKQYDCPYPNKNLCGAVVAFKYIAALYERFGVPAEELEEAAITTVTDTSFLDTNRKKMKVAQLATQMNNMIKGKVTDDKGEPLIGANVTYKGTTYGTITDINGEFSLPKKEGNAILTAHYIGYNPVSIPADTSKTMLIAMHENKTTLNEVVVTGYGTQKKVAVTGAISAVSIKDLKKASGALQKSDTLKDAAISQKADSLQGAVIPEPVTGMKQYKKYLKKNLAYPADDACAEVKGKVTLTFFVNKEGRPFDIKVKESLCKSLDKEAIRLIQEGPDWTYGNQSAEITVKFHK